MTNEELEQIRQRCEAATPGPWTCDPREGSRCVAILEDEDPECNTYINAREHTGRSSTEEDGEFIARVREDVPVLLAEIERLRDEIAKLREGVS